MYASMMNRLTLTACTICITMVLTTTIAMSQEGMSREEVISALKKGIVALKTIDRTEDARRMTNVLERYLSTERRRESPRQRGERQISEREIGVQHVKQMRWALEGLIAAEKKEAAIALEKAIRARELRLEGKDDERSREMIAGSPNRGAQIELLMYAARFLKEQGKTEKAQVVSQLAEKFRRPRSEVREREASREKRGDSDLNRQRERELENRQKESIRASILENIQAHEVMIEQLKVQREKMNEDIKARMKEISMANSDLRDRLRTLNRRDK